MTVTTISSTSSGSEAQVAGDKPTESIGNIDSLRPAIYKGTTVMVKPIRTAFLITERDYDELVLVINNKYIY